MMGSSCRRTTIFSFALLMAAAAAVVLLPKPAEARSFFPGGPLLCQLADYPDLCINMAKGARLGKDATLKALTGLTVKTAISKALEGRAALNQLRASPAVCRDSYDSAVSNLQKAMEGVKATSVPDINIQLSAVITNMGDCDDAYSRAASPVAKTNDLIHRLADNGLAFAAKMKKHY